MIVKIHQEYAALHKKPRSYLRNVTSAKVLKVYFGERLLTNITPADVHGFILYRKEQGKAAATINGGIALLSHMFTWGNRLKLVAQHPVRGTSYLKARRRERYLTHEEIQQLLNACTGDMGEMVMLSLGTGIRASEVLGLDRDHVDMKNHAVVLIDTKSGDRRVVPLPPEVIEMLTRRPPVPT